MLAGVKNKDDLNEVRAAAGLERNTYVGVRKNPEFVVRDEDAKADKKKGWKTLDGEKVQGNVWAMGQPDNNEGLQIYAAFDLDKGKLKDVVNYPEKGKEQDFNKAVVRCCAKGYIPKTFCKDEEV